MAEHPDVAMAMFHELIENHRNDFDGAIVKIEEWRGLINILEKLVTIAREHPDGWDHVRQMFEGGQ